MESGMSDPKADWDAATVPISVLAKRLAELDREIKKCREHGLVVPSGMERERYSLQQHYDEQLKRALDDLM
jgi:hypothetical protein